MNALVRSDRNQSEGSVFRYGEVLISLDVP